MIDFPLGGGPAGSVVFVIDCPLGGGPAGSVVFEIDFPLGGGLAGRVLVCVESWGREMSWGINGQSFPSDVTRSILAGR